jgi:hypothetical protein
MAMKVLRQEWWLDTSALPDLRWARLDFYGDYHVQILDLDGQYHHFRSETEAKDWLREDEYAELPGLIRAGDVPLDLEPPSAPSDDLLISRMSPRKSGAAVPARRRRINVPLLLAAAFFAIIVMALKNSTTCGDRPMRRDPGGRYTQLYDPCRLECCRPDPWSCKCSKVCPCHGIPGHRPK